MFTKDDDLSRRRDHEGWHHRAGLFSRCRPAVGSCAICTVVLRHVSPPSSSSVALPLWQFCCTKFADVGCTVLRGAFVDACDSKVASTLYEVNGEGERWQ